MAVRPRDAAHLLAGLGAVALVAQVFAKWLHVSNAATVSTTFLLVVLVVAAIARFWIAAVTSVAAMLLFNFFFLPPVGTLTIADPQNWVALFAFLAVALVASNLSAVARARTAEAVARQTELARLFDLGRDVLLMTDSREGLSGIARSAARRFDLEFVAVCLPSGDDGWELFAAGAEGVEAEIDRAELASAFRAAQTSLEFDAYSRTYAGHRTTSAGGRAISLVPLRVGTRPVGLLAAAGRPIEAGTLDALAGVVAIAIERVRFLEERKVADLTRRNEELKSALLASLGHDLRTPLTAIRVAAANVRNSSLPDAERAEQIDLILTESERLTRLFQNILDMARIDAGAVTREARWTHPSEIIAVAREQVERALLPHPVEVVIEPDEPVRLDPQLTATALAHLLENAAQYSPAESVVTVKASLAAGSLQIRVRDHGAGIPPADLPHLFNRFYRGSVTKKHRAGTGLGLSIARGLLAVEQGRVWAENRSDGGAEFTIEVPAEMKPRA